jgi:4-hydroxy-4-methyl-2-oxoglutarate aldolase
MLHAAVEVCSEGDILVVANTAPSTHGMFGDLLATSLQVRGVRGLVIDAGVRDTADLRKMGFAVWTQHVSCQGTVKSTAGSVNVPVVIGGTIVHPGDVVCADDDGVVIVGHDDAPSCLQLARDRVEREAVTRDRLASGELGLDIYGLRNTLEDLGVTYFESADDLS